jgi:hypothetical protein
MLRLDALPDPVNAYVAFKSESKLQIVTAWRKKK